MPTSIADINHIINLCDMFIEDIHHFGSISNGNAHYEEYKDKISLFFHQNQNLMNNEFAPYVILDYLHFNGRPFTVNLSEATMIKNTVIELKHDLFKNKYDKIFISHREKDKKQVELFIDLLYSIGIPRPTVINKENSIFCTSHPACYIQNGERNLDEIKRFFQSHYHIFYVLWYTDDYFESQACLNEAGAIWASGGRYQEILAPSFDCGKIGGLLDKQPVWFRTTDKYRLNILKEQLESMFGIQPLTTNAWENARDSYIERMNEIYMQESIE